MIFPEIVQQGDSLVHMNNDEAREYAIKNKTGITTDLELAKFYSENGLIDHTKFTQGGQVMAKKKRKIYQEGGKVGVTKEGKFKGAYETGTPLNEIYNLPSDASDYAKLLASQSTKDALNRARWANFQGKLTDYPQGRAVPSFRYTPGVEAEMKKRGLTRDYIESWQPDNYPDEFANGGILASIVK